jgi:hypothetical protein
VSLSGVNEVGNVTSYRDEVFNETKLASYFGRFQYKLMDGYFLLTGTIRRDGSSNFGKTIVGNFSGLWCRMGSF